MTTTKNIFVTLLPGMVLFVYGLNFPVISEYCLLLAVGALLFASALKMEYHKAFIDRLLLLMLFVASYYTFTTIHGITGFNEAIRDMLEITGAYALGFSITSGKSKDFDRTVPLVVLLMVTGFIIFSFLSVYSFLRTSSIIEIAERVATSFWDGSVINAPGLGAMGSLGMCLLPVVLFGRDDECKGMFYLLVTLTNSLMFGAGVYINVALQNRTPFLATAASLFICTVIYVHRHRSDPAKVIKKLTAIGLMTGMVVIYLAFTIDPTQFNIFTRFTEERLSTGGRLEAWITMLTSLHHSILGGRVVRLAEGMSYVHNLWLDVIWDAGIVPCVFLAAFHLKHVICFKKILTSNLPLLVILMVVGLGTSFFMNFMQEPTLSASVPYFAASCFFLGLVLKLSEIMKSSQVLDNIIHSSDNTGDIEY